jgi:four helix bundle protein
VGSASTDGAEYCDRRPKSASLLIYVINVQRSTFNVQRSIVLKLHDMKDKPYDLEERLLEYAANIIRLVEQLPQTRAGNHVAGQLLRCGTSPLPNHGEAQGAESRSDFVHKISVCYKELRESRRWLRLIARVPLITGSPSLDALLTETDELIKIFAKSLKTARTGDQLSEVSTSQFARNVQRSTFNFQRSTSNANDQATRRRPSQGQH